MRKRTDSMSYKSHIHLAEIQMGARLPPVVWQGDLRSTFDAVIATSGSYKKHHKLSQWAETEAALYCWSLKFGPKLFVKIGLSSHPPDRMKNQLQSMPPGCSGEMLGFAYLGLNRGGVEELETVMLAACMTYMPEINSEWLKLPPRLLGDWSDFKKRNSDELAKRYGIQGARRSKALT